MKCSTIFILIFTLFALSVNAGNYQKHDAKATANSESKSQSIAISSNENSVKSSVKNLNYVKSGDNINDVTVKGSKSYSSANNDFQNNISATGGHGGQGGMGGLGGMGGAGGHSVSDAFNGGNTSTIQINEAMQIMPMNIAENCIEDVCEATGSISLQGGRGEHSGNYVNLGIHHPVTWFGSGSATSKAMTAKKDRIIVRHIEQAREHAMDMSLKNVELKTTKARLVSLCLLLHEKTGLEGDQHTSDLAAFCSEVKPPKNHTHTGQAKSHNLEEVSGQVSAH